MHDFFPADLITPLVNSVASHSLCPQFARQEPHELHHVSQHNSSIATAAISIALNLGDAVG